MKAQTEAMDIQNAKQMLEVEIMHLDPADKAAYLEAKEKAPDLIEKESNPVLYLQFDQVDARKAAKRLAHYWKLRKEIFQERAFLPLNQTGKGALSEEDIEIAKSGVLTLLPNGSLYIDCSRWSESMFENPLARVRCYFYFISLAVARAHGESKKRTAAAKEDSSEGTEGNWAAPAMSTLVRLSTKGHPGPGTSYDLAVPRLLADLALNALPITIGPVHLVRLPLDEDDESKSLPQAAYQFLMDKALSLTVQLISTFFGKPVVFHGGSSKEDILKNLKSQGFAKFTLPTCMGGNWSEENLLRSLRRQLHSEEEVFFTQEEKLQRKRELNRIHSRQKRVRRRIEYEVLQEQSADLIVQNEKLKLESRRLEDLLQRAQQEVKNFEQGTGHASTSSYTAQADLSQLTNSFHGKMTPSMHDQPSHNPRGTNDQPFSLEQQLAARFSQAAGQQFHAPTMANPMDTRSLDQTYLTLASRLAASGMGLSCLTDESARLMQQPPPPPQTNTDFLLRHQLQNQAILGESTLLATFLAQQQQQLRLENHLQIQQMLQSEYPPAAVLSNGSTRGELHSHLLNSNTVTSNQARIPQSSSNDVSMDYRDHGNSLEQLRFMGFQTKN
jgi:hypothetical protein